MTCDLTREQQLRGNFPAYAHTAADIAREAPYARTVARQCATSRSAWMLPHTTTANTTRDRDRIRVALGEAKISYLGHSYGTSLGAVYATLFPRRGDRNVFDSNMGPGGYDVTAFRSFARGMADRFPDFAAYAAEHPAYGLGSTPEQVTAKFFELATRLDAEPVGDFDGTLFRGLTFDRLYSDATLPRLAGGWRALDRGEPVPAPPLDGVASLKTSWPPATTWSAATHAGRRGSGTISGLPRSTGSGTRWWADPRRVSSRVRSGRANPSSRRSGSTAGARRTCSCCRTSATRARRWSAPRSCAGRSARGPGW